MTTDPLQYTEQLQREANLLQERYNELQGTYDAILIKHEQDLESAKLETVAEANLYTPIGLDGVTINDIAVTADNRKITSALDNLIKI